MKLNEGMFLPSSTSSEHSITVDNGTKVSSAKTGLVQFNTSIRFVVFAQ